MLAYALIATLEAIMLEQLVIGLHLATAHFPDRDYLTSNTPGIYARTADGWTAGIYRNSFERTSVYAGRQFDGPLGPFVASISAGVVSGYEYRTERVPCERINEHRQGRRCWLTTGNAEHQLAPMLVAGLTYKAVRLNFLPSWGRPNGSDAINLAVEYKFK
jgi:hypothetical protein